jgi:hypothetical protein
MPDTPQSLAQIVVEKVFTRYQQAVQSVAEDADTGTIDEDILTSFLHDYADSALEQIGRETANAILRSGRATGLEEATGGVDDLVWRRTAVLDDKTCDACDDLDGTEIDSPDEDLAASCLGGLGCRCLPFMELP